MPAAAAFRYTPPAPHPRNFPPAGALGGASLGGLAVGGGPLGGLAGGGALGLPVGGGPLGGLAGGGPLGGLAGGGPLGGLPIGGALGLPPPISSARTGGGPGTSIGPSGSANRSSFRTACFGGGPGGNGGGLNVDSRSSLGANAIAIAFSRSLCLNDFAPCKCPGCPTIACCSAGGGGPGSRTCRNRHLGPWMQNPSLYMLQSLMSSNECLYGQSGSLHSPYFAKNRHVGMRDLSNWCKNPHAFPFMHRFRSQCRHTVCR